MGLPGWSATGSAAYDARRRTGAWEALGPIPSSLHPHLIAEASGRQASGDRAVAPPSRAKLYPAQSGRAGMAELTAFQHHPGDSALDFSLPGVDGKTHRFHDFDPSPYLVVTFWCNHCPYVQAWENRMIALGKMYGAKGVQVVLINSNDEQQYPDDSFDRMVVRAREKGYPFPYLRDETQEVARAYGGLVTPHPMLYGPDRRLIFQGRIDDNHDHPERVKRRYLQEALDAALAGKKPATPEVAVLGCSVKWK
jgi:peroxiredoxin